MIGRIPRTRCWSVGFILEVKFVLVDLVVGFEHITNYDIQESKGVKESFQCSSS